jgi:multiple sugar transport system permease protein
MKLQSGQSGHLLYQRRLHKLKANVLNFEKQKHFVWVLVRTILIIGICYVILYPILLKISGAFKFKDDLYNPNIVWIPHHYTLDNIKLAFNTMHYIKTVWNTFLVAGSSMLLQTVTCALAGYAFARLTFRGSGILFLLVILTILVPPQTLMVSQYLNFKNFDPLGLVYLLTGQHGSNLINSYWPVILTSLTGNGLKSGLYIYIFRQFFKGLPKEIEDAALIDGAGIFQTFRRIMLPNSISSIVTVMLFAFVWQWNDTFMTSVFMNQMHVLSTEIATLGYNATISLGAALGLGNNYKADPYYIALVVNTGILLAILPIIILYSFVQRFFVESVERTGVVG